MLRIICACFMFAIIAVTNLGSGTPVSQDTALVQTQEKTLSDNIITLGSVIGAIVVTLAFGKQAYRCVKNTVTMASNINKIAAELTPNGGSSLRDAVNRIEFRQIIDGERNRAVLNESDHAMFEADRNGNCIWANKTYLSKVGRNLDEISGNGWMNCIDSLNKDDVIAAWELAINQKTNFEYIYKMIDSRNDTTFNVKCRATVLHNGKNEVVGWFGTIKNI